MTNQKIVAFTFSIIALVASEQAYGTEITPETEGAVQQTWDTYNNSPNLRVNCPDLTLADLQSAQPSNLNLYGNAMHLLDANWAVTPLEEYLVFLGLPEQSVNILQQGFVPGPVNGITPEGTNTYARCQYTILSATHAGLITLARLSPISVQSQTQ